jgi:phosphoglycerate dehydrogenase-like enzyme
MLAPEADAALRKIATVREMPGRAVTDADMPELLRDATACLTGWGTPAFSEALLADLPRLGLIAHTAGTVRRMIPRSVFGSRIKVTHATEAMADAVAEHVLAQALLAVQHLHRDDKAMRAGVWPERWDLRRHLLGAQTVGIWGLGRVGLAAARLFAAFGCRVLGSDPTVTKAGAKRLGIALMPLGDMFAQSDIVCLLAPLLDTTRGAIDAKLLARLGDGAVVINSGRGALVDEAALLAELRSGRISAAIDVYPTEPPKRDHPYRHLDNVILSPHVGGHTIETHFRQGAAMVEEIGRYLRGEPLRWEVTAKKADVLA